MTSMPPQQRPEGALIEAARKRRQPRMSGRQAAEKAGISESRWRHIIKGYSTPKAGVYVEVIAPADTLARMGFAVGLTPDELRKADREDAAEFLEQTLGIGDHPTPVEITDLSTDPRWIDLEAAVAGTPPELREIALDAVQAAYDNVLRTWEAAQQAADANTQANDGD